mmetsp:Transcript_9768/g.17247  ORF Transcript_9768/g.17247 Transcript_9768/m.17247 type:complete len:305 (-) Transcript_9768:108-1022(-)
MAALNEVHKGQIQRFVTFFKGKRERLLADRESEKEEFKDDRLDDGAIFNKSDVVDLIDTYHATIIGSIREELENMINLSAVYISQIFGQAETQFGALLDGADVCMIEDQNSVGAITALVQSGAAPAPLTKRVNALTPIDPAAGSSATGDIAMATELQDLKEENRQLSDRYLMMQKETSALLQERSNLSQELEKVKANFQTLRAHMHALNPECSNNGTVIGANAVEIEQALNSTKAALDARTAERDQMSKELNKRLGDSSQFKELKAIVKKKSDEVKLLRRYVADAGLALPDTAAGGVDLAPEDD